MFERSIRSIRKMAGWFLFNCTILSESFLSVPKSGSANNQISIRKSLLVSAWGWASPKKVLLSWTSRTLKVNGRKQEVGYKDIYDILIRSSNWKWPIGKEKQYNQLASHLNTNEIRLNKIAIKNCNLILFTTRPTLFTLWVYFYSNFT